MQVATFEENHYPDARAIINGVTLYIENEALGHLSRLEDFIFISLCLVVIWSGVGSRKSGVGSQKSGDGRWKSED
jgi:hypothetical protein